MLDWDTYAGNDPLPLDPTWAPQGEVDWLPQPEVKSGFDEFGPMFGSEGGDDGGVTDLPPVDVVADPDPDPYDDWWEVGGSPGGGGAGPGGTGGGSSGSASGPDVTGLEGHEGVECAANDIRDDINSKPTNDSAEHVGIVFRGPDGRYYSSPGFTGVSGEVDYVQLGQWMLARNVGMSDIVVIYHNHDAGSSTNPDPDLHRYPSNQNTVAPGDNHDWLAYDGFVMAGVNSSTLRIAIEDQDGVVRYFDYDDRDEYANMTREEMENRDGLPPPTGGCGG